MQARDTTHVHMQSTLGKSIGAFPFEVAGLYVDNGSEFINHGIIDRTADRKIFFTRAHPNCKSDQAAIEFKNEHLVHRYGFY